MHHNNRATAWELDCDFVANTDINEGALCVRVNIQKMEFPRYSYLLGWFPPGTRNPSDFKVFIQQDHDITDQLSVIFDAMDYIKSKIAENNAAKTAKIAQQELVYKAAAEERSRKKSQYEANVQAKRSKNRERTAVGKKGNKEAIS